MRYSTRLPQKGLLAACGKHPAKHAGKNYLAGVCLLVGEGWREQTVTAGAVALPARQPFGPPQTGGDATTTPQRLGFILQLLQPIPGSSCQEQAGQILSTEQRDGSQLGESEKGQVWVMLLSLCPCAHQGEMPCGCFCQ